MQTLSIVVKGLPLDTSYTGYLSVYRLAEFLTQSSENYEVPIFLTRRDSGFEIAANKKSWNSLISVSSSIILAPESLVSEGLLQAYSNWEIEEFKHISKGVEEILNG